jgi:hypothetical protein
MWCFQPANGAIKPRRHEDAKEQNDELAEYRGADRA